MKLLFNFSHLKSGGGQNVAMNFLNGFRSSDFCDVKIVFLVAKNSEPHKYLSRLGGVEFYISPRNPILRIIFEATFLSFLIFKDKINVVYSYFGYSLIFGNAIQISGSADSNIYFPEINFWSEYSGLSRIKKYLVDLYRIFGIKSSDSVVFENIALMRRAKAIFKLKSVCYIPPSICAEYSKDIYCFPGSVPAGSFKILFLCGWQPHKNIMLIPEMANSARNLNLHFILTAPKDNSDLHFEFSQKCKHFDVDDSVSVVGQISKNQLNSLYNKIDVVVLLSKLESFSNNIIEAWHHGKLLVVADAEWSRAICGDAAIYVDRNSVSDIVELFRFILENPLHVKKYIDNGALELKKYPSISEKIHSEILYAKNLFKDF